MPYTQFIILEVKKRFHAGSQSRLSVFQRAQVFQQRITKETDTVFLAEPLPAFSGGR